MVATVSPAADSYEETLSTLRYADRQTQLTPKLPGPMLWIRIHIFSFQIKTQTLAKSAQIGSYSIHFDCHLQIDADPDANADPDPDFYI
jgi:hypothetical protein